MPPTPLRLALVGRTSAHGWCLPDALTGIEPVWVDSTDLTPDLGADVVVDLDPSMSEGATIAALDVPTVAWLGPDAQTQAPLDAYDRVVVTGPVPHGVTPWRAHPIPVPDRMFRPATAEGGRLRVTAPARSTPYRRLVLSHLSDVEGIETWDEDRPPPGDAILLGIHRSADERTFPTWVPSALASGALVISEPLEPAYGLEPGIDFLEITSAPELQHAVRFATESPEAVLSTRRRGAAKAETWRASRAWPALIGDLRRDMATFG